MPVGGRESRPYPNLGPTEVFAITEGQEKLIALVTATLMAVKIE